MLWPRLACGSRMHLPERMPPAAVSPQGAHVLDRVGMQGDS